MPQPSPTRKTLADLKATILRPATPANFQCWFNPPNAVRKWLGERQSSGFGKRWEGNEEFYSLSCAEASLPGSNLQTHELQNDHTGVTERHAYRRAFDDRIEFTFYVDHDYNVIHLFENWIAYTVNEQLASSDEYSSVNETIGYSYRMNFPGGNEGYQTTVYLNKFEKDYNHLIQYRFLKAFPVSINTMPVSYDASDLLRCVVGFTYSRYTLGTSVKPE